MEIEHRLTRIAADVWERLAAQPLTGEALAARVAVPGRSERLLAAVDKRGSRHLLIRLGPGEAELHDRKSRGIEIETRDLLLADGTRGRYLDLTCREALGFDVFDSLGGELAMALAAGIEEPALAVQRIVAKWRRFWLTEVRRSLSREEQIGLFAELWFLNFWLIPRVGAALAVHAWRGPLGARHDFELSECSVEVKATASAVGRVHRIHGIEQLQPPEGRPLWLFSLAVREEGGGANTLSTMVDQARDLASADDETIVRFETRLAESGYTSPAARDEELRLRIVDERLYSVEGTFPRIVPTSLVSGSAPSGVHEITYSIDLGGFDAYVVTNRPEQFALLQLGS